MNIGRIPAKFAGLRPRHTAIVDTAQNRRLDYAQFDEQVRRAANALIGLGAGKGDRIAVLAGNVAEHMILFFACARIGLIIQSLNWRLAAAETARILDDSEPFTVIVQDRFVGLAAEVRSITRSVDAWLMFGDTGDGSYERLLADAPLTEPEAAATVRPDDPNYILYTGGTTGQSKGVLHSHRSTTNSIINNTVGEMIRPSDVYMLTGQMFHSVAILAVSFLAHGGTVVLMDFEPRRAMELIARERVTNFIGVTTMVNWMMALDDFDRFDVSSIRHIMYGGGPLPATVVRQAIAKFGCNFLGCFGQTEGNTMTFLPYEAHDDALAGVHPERLMSCGREAFLTTLEIRDEAGRLIPPGSDDVGEIFVRSPANMIQYWRRPDLTAETLVDGWMRTSDLARWDRDRYVFIVDRAKDMIVTGGENVYSAQVEDAIQRHPAVLETAVIGLPHQEWGEIVVAYVVLRAGMHASDVDIIDMARRHLASYQKPRVVRFVPELPKAPTGKILKRDLRELVL